MGDTKGPKGQASTHKGMVLCNEAFTPETLEQMYGNLVNALELRSELVISGAATSIRQRGVVPVLKGGNGNHMILGRSNFDGCILRNEDIQMVLDD